MADLGDLTVRIKADASQLDRELRRANSTVQTGAQRMQSSLVAVRGAFLALVPAIGVAGIVAFSKQAVEAAGHIKDMADRIGFAASTLAALETPLRASGSNLEEFAASIGILNNQLGEASKGNQEAIKAFDQLGLSVTKLLGMNEEQRFYAVSRAIGQVGDQARFTESGRNLLGRGFAGMIPTIKQYNGDMEKAVEENSNFADSLSPETIDRIDQFGDSLEAAGIKARNAFLEAFAAVLKLLDALPDPMELGGRAGTAAREAMGLGPKPEPGNAPWDDYADKAKAGGFVTEATRVKGYTLENGKLVPPKTTGGRGSNAGLLKPDKELVTATKAYQDYLKAIEDENYLLHINERERAGTKALLEAQTLAQKAHIEISDEDREKIVGMTNANEELRKSMEESARFSQELKDRFSEGLTDIVFSFDSATDAAKRFAEQIARMIVEKKITGPLIDSIMGGLDGGGSGGGGGFLDDIFGGGSGGGSGDFLSGIGDFFGGFFADGGRPPMGKASIVGENGPELFVPDTAGTVVPNGGSMGGSSVSVSHTWQIQSGITRAELASMLPMIEARATAATLGAIERGGRPAQIVGRRNG